MFRSFVTVANTPDFDTNVDKMLMEFYLEYAKPQYQTWSAQKITTVKVIVLVQTENSFNVKFNTPRGSMSAIFEFTLADLPCLNPYDWITLLHLLLKKEKKYEPLVDHIKRMLVSYVYEVAKLDIKIASVVKRKPIVLPQGKAKYINKMKMGED